MLSHEHIIEPLYLTFRIVDPGSFFPAGRTDRVGDVIECCGYGMMSGQTLVDKPPQCISEIYQAAISIAKALHYLHQQEIVFMDLKPSNIVWVKESESKPILKLIDFGAGLFCSELCRGNEYGKCITPCRVSALITPLYTSSEQWSRNQCVGPPHDIWALGIMLSQFIYDAHPYIRGRWGDSLYTNVAIPIIGRRDPNKAMNVLSYRYENHIAPKLKERSHYYQMIGSRVRSSSYKQRGAISPKELIYRLVRHSPLDRPSAEELVSILRKALSESFSKKPPVIQALLI